MAAGHIGSLGVITVDTSSTNLPVAKEIGTGAHDIEIRKPVDNPYAFIVTRFEDAGRKRVNLLQNVNDVRPLVLNETAEILICLAVIESAGEQTSDVLRSLFNVVKVGVTRLALPMGKIARIWRTLIERAADRKRNNSMPGRLREGA